MCYFTFRFYDFRVILPRFRVHDGREIGTFEMCPTRTHFDASKSGLLVQISKPKNRLHGDFSNESSPTRRTFVTKCVLHGYISWARNLGLRDPDFELRNRGLHDLDFEEEIASTRGDFVRTAFWSFGFKNRRSAQERCFLGRRGKNGSKTTHR